MSDPQRYQRLLQLFEAAVDLPPPQREPFLEAACGADAELLLEVREMIEADSDAQADGFLHEPPPGLSQIHAEPTASESVESASPAAEATEAQPDEQSIGPYHLLERLGQGGMGIVHRAKHRTSGTLVALKTVLVARQAHLESLRREIRSLTRLRHPGIVRVFDEGLHEGLPWYAMELLDGVPLSRIWPHGSRPPLEETLRLVHALCAPLAYLHGEGLVHRDLKPQNIFLRNGTPVLIDFGLLAAFMGEIHRDSLELEAMGAGTPAFMAPEQIRGQSSDARVDLYALGCLLFELLTGRRVFDVPRPAELLAAHLFKAPTPPSRFVEGIPAALDELVLRLLAKDPRHRLGHANDLAAALERLGVPAAVAGPPARTYLYRAGFSGRTVEIQRLSQSFTDPAGQRLFVGGQSGIGKTRLALELAREATQLGFQVLTGETLPPQQQGRSGGLGPLRAPLRSLADRCREQGPAEILRVFGARARVLEPYEPSLASLPGIDRLPEPPVLPPPEARQRLFQSLAEVFDAASRDQPLLLILDDLHWANEPTLAFLASLSQDQPTQAPRRWILLGLYRIEEAEDALLALTAQASQPPLELERLERNAVGSMVAEMLALAQPPPVFTRFIDQHSEGNPFFVAEYLRMAVEEGVLWRDAQGVWQLAQPGGTATEADYEALPLPRSLHQVVRRRLDGLPPAAAGLVELACVLGRETSLALLRRLAAHEDAELDAAIQELARRQVLEEVQPGRLRFLHDKLREGAYDQIPASRRPGLHRIVAETLEVVEGHEHSLAERGHHWEQAGNHDRARPCYLAAVRDAQKRFAYDQMERWSQAHFRVTQVPTPESVKLRAEIAFELFLHAGRLQHVEADLHKSIAEAAALGNPELEAACILRLADVLARSGRGQEAQPQYERALGLARLGGKKLVESNLLKNLGDLHRNRGQFDQALQFYQQALDLCREVGSPRGLGMLLLSVAGLHFLQGRLDQSRAHLLESLAIFRELKLDRFLANALNGLASVDVEQQRPEAAQHCEEALELNRRVGDRVSQSTSLMNLARIRCDEGRLELARQLLEESIAVARQIGNDPALAEALTELSDLELLQTGNADQAETLLDQSDSFSNQSGLRLEMANVLCVRGALALVRGHEVRPWLAKAEALAAELKVLPQSSIGRSIERLRHSVQVFEQGEAHRLFRGRLPEDYPPGLRDWLQQQQRLLMSAPEATAIPMFLPPATSAAVQALHP